MRDSAEGSNSEFSVGKGGTEKERLNNKIENIQLPFGFRETDSTHRIINHVFHGFVCCWTGSRSDCYILQTAEVESTFLPFVENVKLDVTNDRGIEDSDEYELLDDCLSFTWSQQISEQIRPPSTVYLKNNALRSLKWTTVNMKCSFSPPFLLEFNI